MAGPMSRADFTRAYSSRLAYIKRYIASDRWPEHDPAQWENYFRIETSNRMREEYPTWGGLGVFQTMGENENVTYDGGVQGPFKRVTHVLRGLGFQVGLLARKHDLDGIVARLAPALGRAHRVSIQTQAANLYNNAFGSTTTADGQALCSTAHTFLRGGGTWSNASSTSAALGQTALETGIVAFSQIKDFEGYPMPLTAKTLLIPPALRPIAHEITMSTLRHDTTTHADNFVHGMVNPEWWAYLSSSTRWFILGPKEQMEVLWIWNIRPETSHGYDFDKEAAKTKMLYASSTVAPDARGVYGSNAS